MNFMQIYMNFGIPYEFLELFKWILKKRKGYFSTGPKF
jgi:hypothetical protein